MGGDHRGCHYYRGSSLIIIVVLDKTNDHDIILSVCKSLYSVRSDKILLIR